MVKIRGRVKFRVRARVSVRIRIIVRIRVKVWGRGSGLWQELIRWLFLTSEHVFPSLLLQMREIFYKYFKVQSIKSAFVFNLETCVKKI